MKIEVLGTGCPKCQKLYEAAQKAVAASGVDVVIEKVEKIPEIMKRGVMMTPALVVADEVKSAGNIPRQEDIETWIAQATQPS